MSKSTASFSAALVLLTTAVSAQTTYHLGVRGGFNRAITTTDPAGTTAPGNSRLRGNSTAKSSINAWQAGAVLEIRQGKLAFQPALLFSQKGEELRYGAYDSPAGSSYANTSTNRYNWLELPLDVVYTLFGDHGPQLSAGPYVALGVGGHQQGDRTYTKLVTNSQLGSYSNAISYGADSYNRRFDAGLRAGIGYRQGPVQVQVSYSWGLTNLHQPSTTPEVLAQIGTDPANTYPYHDYQADAAHNRVAQVTGTYFFSL